MVFAVCNTSLPVIVLGNTYTRANIPALLSTVPAVCENSVLYSEFVLDFPPLLSLRANQNRQAGRRAGKPRYWEACASKNDKYKSTAYSEVISEISQESCVPQTILY